MIHKVAHLLSRCAKRCRHISRRRVRVVKKLDKSKVRWIIRQKEASMSTRQISDYGNLHILDQEALGKIQAHQRRHHVSCTDGQTRKRSSGSQGVLCSPFRILQAPLWSHTHRRPITPHARRSYARSRAYSDGVHARILCLPESRLFGHLARIGKAWQVRSVDEARMAAIRIKRHLSGHILRLW